MAGNGGKNNSNMKYILQKLTYSIMFRDSDEVLNWNSPGLNQSNLYL